jgi:hypothetical protein
MFDDVRMNFEHHVADLHGEILDAAYRPIGGTVRSFHLDDALSVYADSEGLDKILPDDDDLRARVIDGWDFDAAVD